ncbi:MAG TPA: trehalase family glycosidase [Acidobacteriaceae bacterium]|nr:trehalase family glycosidase [Acidobacteriaceae bacterium]
MSKASPTSPSRREFLAASATAAASFALPDIFAQQTQQDLGATPELDRKQLAATLRTLLVSDSPALLTFAEQIYATCILGKIRPAAPPLQHPWIVPGGGYYAQWLWDTMFVVDLLSLLPGQETIIRGVFQNYWDFQQRWDAVKPTFMHGMVANFMAPFESPGARDGKEWQTFPAYSQAPLLAWGMERVYLRNHDKSLLQAGLTSLENFHEWYWRERDITSCGLIGVGSYSGDAQHARFETYDHEVDLDGLKMGRHPARPAGAGNGPWYGDIAIPANTAYLLLSEQSLERMALTLGNRAMASRRRARYERGAAAMREHVWDDHAGCFLAVNIRSMEKVRSATVGGFMPLMAGVPSAKQAAIMAKTLSSSAWSTKLPIPTVARTDPQFSSGEFWRGDVWPAPNYQVASGLSRYGQLDTARTIADATVANTLANGISERYDSLSGKPLGVAGLGMSSTTLTMILDGLTSERFKMRVRGGRP